MGVILFMSIGREWQKFKAMCCFFAKKQNPVFAVYDYIHKKNKYGIKPEVYFKWGLDRLTFANLASYVSYDEYLDIIENRINNDLEAQKILRDKGTTLRRLPKHLLKREFLDLRYCDFEDFYSFVNRHKKIVVKVYNSAMGDQVNVVDTEREQLTGLANKEKLERVFADYQSKSLYIIEEYIHQHHEWSRINPYCVNTIRVHTVKTAAGKYETCWHWLARFGRKGESIDMHGAFVVLVDPESGRIITDALDEGIGGREWFLPSESPMKEMNEAANVRFKDIVMPFKDEVKEVVEEAAALFPEIPLIGWDVALTEEGPAIVEGNGCPVAFTPIQQLYATISSGVFYREELENVMKKI
ncbi:MAG: sugar-transfer associated ATP-grasp domain-containing protein [Acidaminococcaceae bacterium]